MLLGRPRASNAPGTTLKPGRRRPAEENAVALTDPRSVRAVQTAVNAPPTGRFDEATSQLIADLQQALNVKPTGVIDESMLHRISRPAQRGRRAERSDPTRRQLLPPARGRCARRRLRAAARPGLKIETGGTASPTALLFGPSAFGHSQPAAAIVHTIAHAYEDARLRREKHNQAVRDFLAIRVQIVSKDMAEELFIDLTFGFGRDAVEALRLFRRLTPQERFRLRTEISEVQSKVAERASQHDPTTCHRLSVDSLPTGRPWSRSAFRPPHVN